VKLEQTQTISLAPAIQILFLVLSISLMLGAASGAGMLAANLREARTPVNRAWRSAMPLTSAALLAELKPPADLSALSQAIQGAAESLPDPAAAPAPPALAAAPASDASKLQPGVEATISNLEPSGCLNLRESPGGGARVLGCLPQGENVRVEAGPREADGYRWWQVDRGGWLAETYLAPKPVENLRTAAPSAAPGTQLPPIAAAAAQSLARRYTGWATYYGIEDGFRLGDVMYDGTAYNPGDPTMTAASFQLPLHSWLLVCSAVRCLVVQVRDRGLLDENGILLDLSRAAYAQLFSGLGGKQLVTAFIIDPGIVNLLPPLTPSTR
jgi:hypothetical protein